MTQDLGYLKETPSQTAGPYVHIGLIPQQAGFDMFATDFGAVVAAPDTPGERIVIEGRVIDGAGDVLRDALIETWQADAAGEFNADGFRGWGRAGSDFETGVFRIETIKPGRVRQRDGRWAAPHISVWIVARGIHIGLATRLYFSDEAAANLEDPVLNLIEAKQRRQTLIAQRQERDGTVVYTFDIVLQGADATVFFDV